jgi:hypothetical protein
MKTIPVKEVVPNFEETEFGVIIENLNAIGIEFKEVSPWIMGGSVLKTYMGLPLGDSDIDIFVGSLYLAAAVESKLNENLEAIKSPNTTRFSLSYKLPYVFNDEDKEVKVQVVNTKIHSNMSTITDGFDINVCRIVFDGNNFHLHELVDHCIQNKTMNIQSENSPNPFFTLTRMMKYSRLGFTPTKGSLYEFFNAHFKPECIESLNKINGVSY